MPGLLPRRTPQPRYSFCLTVLAGLLTFSLTGSALAQQPVTGAPVSYTFGLQPGHNLVALPVAPETASAEAILADVLPVLTLVQDDYGNYDIPSQGIDGVDNWDWTKTYRVHVATSASFTVEGPAIVPEASPIVLREGPNWVPYLRNGALPIQEALGSIASSLLRVEDANGQIFEPDGPNSTLSWMLVGQGYKVWVDRADTLYYPANTIPGNGASEAGTIAEALALTGLEVGQEIEVLGYYTPGDGGGGRFRVEASGAAPDGGMVFVPNQFTSAPITETWRFSRREHYFDTLPAGQRVVFGSLSVDLLHPNSGNLLLRVDGRHLHGHEWVSRFSALPLIDYESGQINDRRERFKQECARRTGDGWSCDMRITYRHTTSDLRLRRLNVGASLNAHWFGARPRTDDPDFDNQPVLNHMINVANQRNAEAPGSITTIEFPVPAVYEYFGSVQLGDGLTLKGAGGTELVTVTNDLGHTYQPVRVKAAHTTLRLKDGEALKHIRMEKSPSDPFYLEPDIKQILHTRRTAINVQPDAMTAGWKTSCSMGTGKATSKPGPMDGLRSTRWKHPCATPPAGQGLCPPTTTASIYRRASRSPSETSPF